MIPWGGISCCLSAAALYLLGRSSGRSSLATFLAFGFWFLFLFFEFYFWFGGCRDAEALKSVTRVQQLKDLGTWIGNFVFLEPFGSPLFGYWEKGAKITERN